MKVVITGAGIGGLACSIACRRENITVEILEKSLDIQEVGAGIQIPPNGSRILREFGLLLNLVEKGSIVEHVDFRRYTDGRLLRSMPFGDGITEEFGAPWIIIHRVDYHRILLDEAIRLGAILRLGATVAGISVDGPAALLVGEERVPGDVLIGADGLWSTVREAVLEEPIAPAETGDLAYRATLAREQLEALDDDRIAELCRKTAVTSWFGPERHAIFYPVRGAREFNLVLLRPDNLAQGSRREEVDVEEMRESYSDWDTTLQKIISCVAGVYKWKLTHLPELPSWARGQVALLGDACHPTLPYQAQGAAMAVEDGATIGKLLGLLTQRCCSNKSSFSPSQDPSRDDVTAVLNLYEQIRKTRTTRSVQGAFVNRKLFHLEDGVLQVVRDVVLALAGVTRQSDWTWFSSFRQRQTLGHDVLCACGEAFEEFWASRRLKQRA